jgi:hypothetical protein
MEAYQKLDRKIDTKCCNAIQIAISTVDRYPGTVTLELVLLDTQSPHEDMLSLGSMEVTARPQSSSWTVPALPQIQTLDFAIPTFAPLRQFDVIKVIFHRDPLRQETSARISIDRFLLLPRT